MSIPVSNWCFWDWMNPVELDSGLNWGFWDRMNPIELDFGLIKLGFLNWIPRLDLIEFWIEL